MPARLFRRIQSFFSRLNKPTLLVATAVLITIAAGTFAYADQTQKPILDATYNDYLTNFTTSNDGSVVSGITGGTALKSTTNNDVQGLVFTINLGVKGDTGASSGNGSIEAHWGRVAVSSDSFLIKLCMNNDPTQCWLNTVGYTNGEAKGKHIIAEQDSLGNTVDTQTLSISAFIADTNNGGSIYSYNPTTNTVVSSNGVVLQKGVPLTATLWYCGVGNGSNAADAYKNAGVTTANPTTYSSNLCGGFSYFQIGQPLPITIPTDAATIAQQATSSEQALKRSTVVSSAEDSNLPVCGIGILWSSGTINGCAARIAYGIYYLTELVAALFGKLFDFFIGYSVSDTSYRYGFAVTGWRLVRDISNIFFIIIMVWTGFSAVFETNNTSMKKVVPALIVNALLINFSLFATRVVIDISNITARMFYSQMLVCEEVNKDSSGHCIPGKTKTGTGGYWPLSEAIVGAFNPQKIFQASILQQSTVVSGDTATDFNAQNATQNKPSLSATDSANYFAAICLIGAFIMVIVAVMFFKVTFLFVGRVVGLYICMIFSPFAFLSRDIPMLGGIERLRWDDWRKELISYALLAPIFIFFLYIIYILLSSNFAQEIGNTILSPGSTNVFELIISTAVPMAIIYFLLQAAQKTAEKYAGEIGRSIQGFGEQVTGLAIGAATGGAAYVGTRTGSRITKAVGEKTGLTNWAANNANSSSLARWTNNALSKSQAGSWDVRQTTAAAWTGKIFKTAGIGNNIEKYAGIGEKYFEEGYKGQQKRRQEKIKKNINDRINYEHLTDDQAKALWEKYKTEEIADASEKGADKTWEKYIDKDAKVAPVNEQVALLKETENTLKANQAILLAEAETLKNTRSSSASEATEIESKAIENRNKQTENTNKLAAATGNLAVASTRLQALRDDTIADHKKNGTEKTSAAYIEAKNKAVEDRQKELDAYGDIKNGKDFTAAMRREYAVDLRNDSFWMKDGKQREGFFAELMGERLKFEQEALDEATKSYIKDFDKKQGKEGKVSQLKKKLQKYDETVTAALVARGKTTTEVEKMDLADKQDLFKTHVVEAQAGFDTANAKFKKTERDFNDDKITDKQFKEASKAKKQSEDELNEVKNLWTNREKIQDDLQKESDKEKDTKPKEDSKK